MDNKPNCFFSRGADEHEADVFLHAPSAPTPYKPYCKKHAEAFWSSLNHFKDSDKEVSDTQKEMYRKAIEEVKEIPLSDGMEAYIKQESDKENSESES